jgi:hypothetical protein
MGVRSSPSAPVRRHNISDDAPALLDATAIDALLRFLPLFEWKPFLEL